MNLERREEFLTFIYVFLGTLLLLVWGLGWAADLTPAKQIHWSLRDLAIGAAAGAAMMAVASFVPGVKTQAEDVLGGALAACRQQDFVILAVLGGLLEELLFRGVLEPWAARLHPVVAWLAVNALFGMLHAVSWTYAITAMTLGCLFSGLAWGIQPTNLLRPIVAHAVYDYIGFVWIAATYRPPSPPAALPDPPPEEQPDAR